MGGEIEAESAAGKGSTFTPLSPTTEIEDSVKVTNERILTDVATSRVSVNNLRILVAEDNPVNQDLLSAQMELLGYSADYANNGVEALKLWNSGQYHLLLTDIRMPQMDGYQLIRTIRDSDSDNSKCPLIAVTANVMQSDIKQCLESGANDVLSKPFSLDALRLMLEKWIKN